MDPKLQETLRLRDLRLVDALAAEGTLVGASRRLGQSQPATTKSLQALEAVLGIALFERTAKGITPTSSGSLLTETATRVLREMSVLDTALSDLKRGRRQTLTIGAETGTADAILMSALARTRQSQPDLDVRIVEDGCERLIEALSDRHLDLVIGRLVDDADADGLHAERLYDEPITLMARTSHPIFDVGSVDSDLVGRFDAIVAQATGQVALEVEDFIRQSMATSPRLVKSSSVALIKEMVHITDCVVAGPATLLAGDIQRGNVKIVALPQRSVSRPAGCIYRKDDADFDEHDPFLTALRVSAAKVQPLLCC